GEEQGLAFQTLIDKLCNAPFPALPEGTKDFVVYCDASGIGLGCVLMQREAIMSEKCYRLARLSLLYASVIGHFLKFPSEPNGRRMSSVLCLQPQHVVYAALVCAGLSLFYPYEAEANSTSFEGFRRGINEDNDLMFIAEKTKSTLSRGEFQVHMLAEMHNFFPIQHILVAITSTQNGTTTRTIIEGNLSTLKEFLKEKSNHDLTKPMLLNFGDEIRDAKNEVEEVIKKKDKGKTTTNDDLSKPFKPSTARQGHRHDNIPMTIDEMLKRVDDYLRSEEAFHNMELPKLEIALDSDKLNHLVKDVREKPLVLPRDLSKEALVVEAEVEGYLVRMVHIDEGTSIEIMFEHCFNMLHLSIWARDSQAREIPHLDTNPVLVKKGDGSWRMYIDFKNINAACPKDYYPLPGIDKKIELVMGFLFKCFLDSYKGYHQVQMAEEDEEKTTFHKDQGTYCYIKMSFGRNLEAYVDDMVVKSKSEREMLADIAKTAMLLVVRKGKQYLVHYVSKTQHDVEWNYAPLEKVALALWHMSRRLRRPCLHQPHNDRIYIALRLKFESTNNQAKYEALQAGLRIAKKIEVIDVLVPLPKALRKANCLVERENRSLMEGIKTRLGQERKDLMDELPNVLWTHQTSLKTSNGETPYNLTFKSEAFIPAEISMLTHRTMMIKEGEGNEEEMI
nr:reverse transcriptase domain-containing protein [Tanacetum cinerariifolium]